MRILIKGGRVIDPQNGLDAKLDVYIENGVISEIGEGLDYGGLENDILDAGGMIVAPGLVDMHCHLREPGFEYKEDIESGARSAAVGGFTSVACMPNTKPVIDNGATVSYVLERSRAAGGASVYPIGAATKGQKGETLAEIGEMKFAGIVAISDDGMPISNPAVMRRALQYASMFDTPLISHCEDMALTGNGVMNEGFMSTYLGLPGITSAAEEVMVARDIILAETEGLPVHLAHISTAGSVGLIRAAKARGVRVTAETCPHYFSLTEDAVKDYDTNAKMNPPLRTRADVAAIIEGLSDGTIDAIATDHAPHHVDEKRCEFEKAANGIVGFETALALSITHLVRPGVLTLSELIEKMSVNPARILGLSRGTLGLNHAADITIFAPDEEKKVDASKFLSKSKNTPFDGESLFGRVYYTIVGGRVIVRQGEI